jgi:regulatory protein
VDIALPEDIAADPDADPESVARAICLRLLTARARSRAELAAALQTRGVADEVAHQVLDRFTAVGLIDDRAFSAGFVQMQRAGRGLAAREIARQLRTKGVDDETAAAAVADLDAEAERDTAARLVARRLRSMSGLDETVKIRRLVSLLARKGYPPGLCYEVVRAAVHSDAAELAADDTAWLA